MSDTLSSLNPEQREAVTHGNGPLLIIAGAGTGKTTVVTQRIKHLIIDKEINPSEILALTFTEKAAREMEERVDVALPYGYSELWISTFHAFCDRVLRSDGIHIGLNGAFKLMTEAEAMLFLRKNLFKLGLEYFRPLGNPYKFISGLLTHFNRLKDDDITPEDYLQFAKKLESDQSVDEKEIKKTQELAKAYKIYEELKATEGMMDFSDLNANVLKLFRERPNILQFYQKQFKYILVDEFQDTNFAQNELAILLAGEKQNITVVGDDDQCLVADTKVSTPSGKKVIQDIQTGDRVLTAVGRGAIDTSTVTQVFKNRKDTMFITVTTKSGKTLTATANHKMFCYLPKRVIGKQSYEHIDTETKAHHLADDTGVDLNSYHSVLDAVNRAQSHRVIINLYMCHRNYTAKSKGKILSSPKVSHLVHLETSDPVTIKLLTDHAIQTTKAKKGVRIRKQFQDIREADLFAKQLAEITGGFIEMKSRIGILQQVSQPAFIIPAGNLVEGCFVPIETADNRVVYDEIISIQRTQQETTVYDLEIANTHNFIADDIVVHNSIYRWRGAALANIIQFRDHFPNAKIVTLTKNYRSTEAILNGAYQLIQNNNPDRLEAKEHLNKRLTAERNTTGASIDFLFAPRVENEAELVLEKIQEGVKKHKRQYKDFAILVRANDHSQPFVRALERAKVPYQFLGPGHLFHQEEIKDLIAYLKGLYNFEDNASMYRVLTMDIWHLDARDIAAILNYAKKKNYVLFEALEHIDDTFLADTCKEKIHQLVDMVHRHLKRVPRESAGQVLYYFIEDSGILRTMLQANNVFEEKRAQNIAKFFEKLKSYEGSHEDASVFAVVDWIDLSMQLGESPLAADTDWSENNAVNILTVHSSKGLEFPVVFVTNLVTQRFPTRERREQIPIPEGLIREELPEGDANLQEERRLFYVAMTRAKDELYLTAANFYGEGKRERKISPFVFEALGKGYMEALLNKEKTKTQVSQLPLFDFFAPQTPLDASIDATIPHTPLPISYISYTQIQTFDACPLHYKLKYILKIPGQPSAAQSFGTSVHAVLRDCYQLMIRGEQVTDTLVDELLQRSWINEGFTSKSHQEACSNRAKQVLKAYFKDNLPFTNQPLAVETPFSFLMNGLKIGGRIDRVDQLKNGSIEIVDYKTGNNMPKEKELLTNLQLTFYALAATEVHDNLFGKQPEEVLLSLHYVEENQKLTTTRTREQLEEAKQQIIEKVKEISMSDLTCHGTQLCKNCEYSMLCTTFAE